MSQAPVPKNKKKVSLKKLPGFTTEIYHEETNLVFRSKTDTIVIGKFVDGKIENLTEDDIKLCEFHTFKYELPVKSEEEEEEEEEVEEVEVQEEEVADDEEGEEEVADAEEGTEEGEKEVADDEEGVEEEVVEEGEEEVADTEEGVEEVVEEEVEEVKTVAVEVSGITSGSTNNFQSDISTITNLVLNVKRMWDETTLKNHQEILDLNNKILRLEDNLKKKVNELSALTNDHKQLQDNFDKMKTKFDSIQKLFA